MTRRPDSQDRAACRCHPAYKPDWRLTPPALAPSSGWRSKWRQRPTWADLELIWAYAMAQTEMITRMGAHMSEIDVDLDDLNDATNDVADRVDEQDAKIAELAEALANAQPGSDEAAQLKQQLADASTKIRTATARLRELAADPENPVPDPAPADGGDSGTGGDVPADGGGDAPLDPNPQPGGGDGSGDQPVE